MNATRKPHPMTMSAEEVLAYLAHWGDTLQARGRTLFVVDIPPGPEGDEVLDTLIAAAGAAEDLEENMDDEGVDADGGTPFLAAV